MRLVLNIPTPFQAEGAITYPKPGVAYDPAKVNAWSQHRGFQNPAQVKYLIPRWEGEEDNIGALREEKILRKCVIIG
jgi:hypothetical protein